MFKDLVVSVDGGQIWSTRGTLSRFGYAQMVFPLSRKVAWRTGDQSDLYRTTDGTHWTDVLAVGDDPRAQYVTPTEPFLRWLGPSGARPFLPRVTAPAQRASAAKSASAHPPARRRRAAGATGRPTTGLAP
jgi:hypothetical protein